MIFMQRIMKAVIGNDGRKLSKELTNFTKRELIEFIEGMKELGGYNEDLPNLYRDYCSMVGNADDGC
jgi:hypothetical protein